MEVGMRRSISPFDNSVIQALGKRRLRTLKHLGAAVHNAVQGRDSAGKTQTESWGLLWSAFSAGTSPTATGENTLSFDTEPFELLVRCWASLPQASGT